MRILAVSSRTTDTEHSPATAEDRILAFFDAPAILRNEHATRSVAPQTLWLYPAMHAALYHTMAKNAAFIICFDPTDAPISLADEPQCIALTTADAPPNAAHFCGIGAQLVDVFHSSMPQPLKNTVCCELLSALLAMYDTVVQYRQRDAARCHNRTRLITLRQAIYSDPSAQWSINQMCTQINVSRAHLHRIYQETFGVGCHTDVLQSRLLHATDMLISSDASIRTIALACGFENDITFMRAFKKHLGCTPTTYRQAQSVSSKCTSERP